MPNAWKSVDRIPPVEEGEIQVWRLELEGNDSLMAAAMPFLTLEEQERAERRRAGRVREEFVVARACLRLLLGSALDIEPPGVLLTEGLYGKPAVFQDRRSISFNVTHSRGMILIALSRSGDVGIDIERIDSSLDIMEVAESAFHPDEVASLRSIDSPETKRLAFYRCWTQKEAIIKADGRGLSLPLTCFKVPLLSSTSLPIEIAEPSGEPGKSYILSDIPLDAPVVGAIATDSHDCGMNWLNFPLSAFSRRL
ncbi:MAG: 4'-phosphopantetheinyl transferase superfamily protein [Acidobacteria bacterium]|nr:4'-phosphopantetheinyl transferase superfamily protein [Acidobacteriota bacterium]